MKYSIRFNEDFNFYLSNRHFFKFCGKNIEKQELNKNGIDGIDGKEAFFIQDSQGKFKPTKHPRLLKSLLQTKASVNFHIKMWADGRAEGTFPGTEFEELCKTIKAPRWFYLAVERQKYKNYLQQNLPEYFIKAAKKQQAELK